MCLSTVSYSMPFPCLLFFFVSVFFFMFCYKAHLTAPEPKSHPTVTLHPEKIISVPPTITPSHRITTTTTPKSPYQFQIKWISHRVTLDSVEKSRVAVLEFSFCFFRCVCFVIFFEFLLRIGVVV
jgi:hypothetical protein